MDDNHYAKPREWVSRVIVAVGVEVTDKDAYWLGFHMERFLAYCQKHGAFLDLATAVAAYKVFIQQMEPRLQGRQLKQAGGATERTEAEFLPPSARRGAKTDFSTADY
jgi:hypothetical protein